MIASLTGTDPETVKIGMPVEVAGNEDVTPEWTCC